MCQFFSFCTKGSQKFYFDWKQRQELLKNNPKDYNPDSHSSICHFFGIDEDKVNKYEYYPITKEFKADQINIKDDRALAEKWVKKLDFKTIVEPLIIKEIVNPLKLKAPEFNDEHKLSLKKWASVGASVRASIWASVGDSVRASIWASVGDSVWASVGASVWDSVRDSVRVYISSFFILDKVNPFQSCIDLWELGFVPSFDGKTWRVHAGEKAEIVFEISGKELKEF
jgi:hypothetical protein